MTYLEQHHLVGSEIYDAIRNSKVKLKHGSVVIIGDSVAYQLYGKGWNSDKLYSLACNQAVSLAGQYILLQNTLIHNPHEIDKVYLVMHPISFRNNLDQVYVYNYFVKPFYTNENSIFFTEDTKYRITKIPNYYTYLFPFTKITNYSPNLDGFDKPLVSAATDKKHILSHVSIEYLNKMSSDLKMAGIQFEVVSPVLNVAFKSYDISDFKKIIQHSSLRDNFRNYFNFTYLEKNNFTDMLHYSQPKSFGRDPLKLDTAK